MYDDSNPPVNVNLSQLRQAMNLMERAAERATDNAEPSVTFETPHGMVPFHGGVIAKVSVYRGGGSDSFEQLITQEGEVLVEWSSDERDR